MKFYSLGPESIHYTVEPQYSAHDWEISKSKLYQSVHYIEVLYNITYNVKVEADMSIIDGNMKSLVTSLGGTEPIASVTCTVPNDIA